MSKSAVDPPGGFLVLRVDDDTTHFGQIVTRKVVSTPGPGMAAQFSAGELGQTGPGAASIGLSTRLEIRRLEGGGAVPATWA